MGHSPHLKLARWYWTEHLQEGDVAIDATCGNGHDTLFLAELPLSSLYSIDIQPTAIRNTKELLVNNLNKKALKKVIVSQISHDDLKKIPLPKPPSLIVYNLGYLPGGDKTITTSVKSTLSSVHSALSILSQRGAISITCYPGHEEGRREEEKLLIFSKALPSNEWRVLHHFQPNRPQSPSLLWIHPR